MNADARSDTLLIFARNPVAGRVKTRLIDALGARQALDVYERLLRHTFDVAGSVGVDNVQVYIDDGAPNPDLRHMLDRHRLAWQRQRGQDLGARMLQAIAATLHSASRTVLIGTDCPEFDRDYLAGAFTALSAHDVVIGPAADGGYVLIGMKQPHAELFSGIPWGSDRVLELTRQRLARLRLDWHELPTLNDVDDADDLSRFPWLRGETAGPV